MIFTQTDRVMLKIVHENLGTVLLGVGFRTDAKSLHQRVHELEGKLDAIGGVLAELLALKAPRPTPRRSGRRKKHERK